MNRYYISTVAALAAMLSACTSSELEPTITADNDAIEFGTYVDMQSRALEKSTFSEGDKICINAFQSEGTSVGKDFTANFMENETLTKTASGWTYANPKFWPMNSVDRISFVASHPYIAPTIAAGICTFPFEVNANPAAQTDLLWSTITDANRDDRNGTHQNGVLETPATSPRDNVVLHFRHALSKVVFNAKAATYYNGTTITITDIAVKNLYAKGSYSLTKNLEEGSWTLEGEANNGYTILTGGTDTAIDTRLKSFGTSLLMIPQTLSTDAATAPTVTIKYTVTYSNPNKTVNEERTFNLATDKITVWEQNKAYNYNFNITLDMITFDAVIENWDGTDDSEISVN